jgi:hypothetical protein
MHIIKTHRRTTENIGGPREARGLRTPIIGSVIQWDRGMMNLNNEYLRICKEAVMASAYVGLLSIYLGELMKPTKYNQNCRFSCRELNLGRAEYEAGVPTT